MRFQQDETIPSPTPQPDPPQIEFQPITIKAKDARVNIRSAPTLTGNIIARLDPTPTAASVSLASWYTDEYEWKRVQFDAIDGYLAWEFVEVVTITPPPDPDYKMTLAAIQSHAEAAIVAHNQASEAYGAILAILDGTE